MTSTAPDACLRSLTELLVQHLEEDKLTLPPLPDVAQQVLAVVSDDATSAATLASLVQRDAGLASTLVRYANSAALSGVTRTVSVQQAVSRLGMNKVAELALSASLRSGVDCGRRYRPLLDACWRRSLATGLFAKEVARALRRNVEVSFLCGLLRGIGPPLVFHALSGLPQTVTLPNAAGATELGGTLGPRFVSAAVRAWGLPQMIAAAIEDPGELDGRSAEASVAALAQRLTDLALSEPGEHDPSSLSQDSDAVALNLYPDALEALLAQGPSIRDELEAM